MQRPLGKLSSAADFMSAGLLATALEDSYTLQAKLRNDQAPDLRPSSVLPFQDLSWDEAQLAYLREEWASKYPFVVSGIDREQVALQKFLESETICRQSNEKLTGWDTRPSIDFRVFARARRLIGELLGPVNLDEIVRLGGFGPGASTSLRRSRASQQNKWVRSSHITEKALPWFTAFRRWAGVSDVPSSVEVVAGNRVTTVPKNSKTDRVIAIEPDWNMFFQKGVGRAVRRRLQRRAGLLTPNAQAVNRAYACRGSMAAFGFPFATIDLSGASDSVSLALCEALLPRDWFQVIISLRSEVGTVGDALVPYEKVSSMGNGFTFELETLLFWGLAKAVSGTRVRVYGDDIIVPTASSEAVIEVLAQAGFSTNPSKTFVRGPFRESCGGHYFDGRDISPFYYRKPIVTVGQAITLANQINDWCLRYGGTVFRDPILHDAWAYLRSKIPSFLRGPSTVEGCLHSNWDECAPVWSRRTQSYTAKVVQFRQARRSADPLGGLLYKLWSDVPDLVASEQVFLDRSLVEGIARVHVDRDGWEVLPAWLLCQ